jgi:alkylation response protein AidB-like acyl-CoA dehydrogenase
MGVNGHMDFELTKEQKSIQKAAAEFAEREFGRETALRHEQSHSYPFELRKKACELGPKSVSKLISPSGLGGLW